MLTFIGLGLFDKEDVSEKGLRLIRGADSVFLEGYTSRLMGATKEDLESFYGRPVRVLMRADVEQHPDELLDCAARGNTVFLCAGDPMVSTTHADLRIRAAESGYPDNNRSRGLDRECGLRPFRAPELPVREVLLGAVPAGELEPDLVARCDLRKSSKSGSIPSCTSISRTTGT